MNLEFGPSPDKAYLVIAPQSGLFGAWLDEALANIAAQAVKGVVCEIGIKEDYRDGKGSSVRARS